MGKLRNYFLNHYPRTDFHELNQDWMISMLFDMINQVENFVEMNSVKYADPIQWDITRQYEKNTIVIDEITGTAYITSKPVPKGVALSRTEYWNVIFDLGRFITLAAQNFANSYEAVLTTTATMETDKDKWVVWNSILYRAKNDIHVGDRYVIDGNIEKYTVEMFFDELAHLIAEETEARIEADTGLHNEIIDESVARENADIALQDNIDAEATARKNADTTLQNNIGAEATARENADTTLQDNIDAEIENRTNSDNNIIGLIQTANLKPLDVTLHGIVGDGTTINDDAFTVLLSDFPDYSYYFPKGVYRFGDATFSGNIQLIGNGDAIIIGFNYTDLSFPNANVESVFDIDQAFFSAKNIKFKGESNNYGLTIHVQSQGSVLRTFDISDCVFYGTYGLRCINCITGNISSCDFIKNIIGILFESSTNMTICECNWYSPIIGIKIGTSGDDSVGRHGGESIMLTACQMIDGVTGIYAVRHNYLELTNCMFDYFNCCIWLDASRFARIINTYLGYHEGNKSATIGYIAPPQYGALWGYSSVRGIPFSVECINAEFVGYGDTTHIPVVLNGTGLTTGEDLDIVACRFSVISSSRANTLLYITKCSDVYLDGNRFYAPSNNNLEQPFVISESARVINSSSDYANCFNTQSVTIQPTLANRQSNNTYQEAIEVHKTADNTSLISIPVTFNAQYDSPPKVVATIMGGTDYYKCICSVTALTRTGCTLNIYNPSNTLSGEYYANILVMHHMF